jgi:molybdate transport system regulatory protein
VATRLVIRIDFDSDRRLGPGKIALLEAIGTTGSIAAAGRGFGMSYRRAWLLTDELNRTFDMPLIEAHGGGRSGGGTNLTPLGARVVELYRTAEANAKKSIAREVRRMERSLTRPRKRFKVER